MEIQKNIGNAKDLQRKLMDIRNTIENIKEFERSNTIQMEIPRKYSSRHRKH